MSDPDLSLLRLRPLDGADRAQAVQAHQELQEENFSFLLGGWSPGTEWHAYLRKLRSDRHDGATARNRVPATFLVAVIGDQIVGRTSIRHRLNQRLLEDGGHIGYAVRPQFRRRGYATVILRQSLIIARAEGVERVLMTCDDNNQASIRIIESAGGVLEDIRPNPDKGVAKRRYWI